MNGKRKGSAGEREFARILQQHGYTAHRNDQRFTGGLGRPDVSADELNEYHFEVKRVERLNVPEAMRQALRDCAGRVPAVVHRRSREPWLITLQLEDWLRRQ